MPIAVKNEKPVCVASFSKADLSKASYKMKSAPQDVREHYESLKKAKASKSDDKKAFLQAVLQTNGFSEPVFQKDPEVVYRAQAGG